MKIEQQITECLTRLRQEGCIDGNLFEQLKPVGTLVPPMYELPKVHEPKYPLKPILYMCNSPYHELAKWLDSLLQPIRKQLCAYSLYDTSEFMSKTQDLTMDNRKMCSLDVSSLYT